MLTTYCSLIASFLATFGFLSWLAGIIFAMPIKLRIKWLQPTVFTRVLLGRCSGIQLPSHGSGGADEQGSNYLKLFVLIAPLLTCPPAVRRSRPLVFAPLQNGSNAHDNIDFNSQIP